MDSFKLDLPELDDGSEKEITSVMVRRLTEDSASEFKDIVVKEFPLTVMVNNHEAATLLCTPSHLAELAVGYLFSEDVLRTKEDISDIQVDDQRGVVRIDSDRKDLDLSEMHNRFITSGCANGSLYYDTSDLNIEKVTSEFSVSVDAILALVKLFHQSSDLFRRTGGIHSAALCTTQEIILFREDIGRHNALDKIFGECLLNDIPLDDKLVISSGRISSEMLLKVAKRKLPVIISKSAPTDLGISMAQTMGITLVGHVRGGRMNVYTETQRITGPVS